MAQNFSRKELISLYKSSKKGRSDTSTVVSGDSVLERLKKLSYLNSLRAIHPRISQPPSDQKTIAICLVIVDTLPHEEIWRVWTEQESDYNAKVFIHAKYPDRISSPWARSRTLDKSYHPEWNSPEVIRAMLATLSWAFEDTSCGRFVFGTESCIPVYSLQEAGDMLFEYDRSWLDAYHRPKDNYEEQYCFFAVNPSIIPQKSVWKALPGWVMLTRRHAQEILALPALAGTDDLVLAWNTVHAPEEVYFATMLALLGFLRDGPVEDEVERRQVTYAKWEKKGDANPIRFSTLSDDLLCTLRSSGAVFGRKFGPGSISAEMWTRMVSIASGSSISKRTGAGTIETAEDSKTTILSSTEQESEMQGVKIAKAFDGKYLSAIDEMTAAEFTPHDLVAEEPTIQTNDCNIEDEHIAKKQKSS